MIFSLTHYIAKAFFGSHKLLAVSRYTSIVYVECFFIIIHLYAIVMNVVTCSWCSCYC